jgi:hypothetical protein
MGNLPFDKGLSSSLLLSYFRFKLFKLSLWDVDIIAYIFFRKLRVQVLD